MAKRLERKSDLDFIKDEDNWPCWPILPMKRGPRNEEVGCLVHVPEGTYVLFLQKMFVGVTADTPRQTFLSAEAVVEAGWRVD